ncbi:MAG: dicarboxylate/amino acid:cation symporter [Victivallaceae bacterium]
MKLWMKLFLGLACGLVLGLVLGDKVLILKNVGTVFLNLLSMVVCLLVFSSIVTGITALNDIKKLGRIGFKSIFLYFLTTAIAIVIGLVLAIVIKPGIGMHLTVTDCSVNESSLTGNLFDLLLNIVPSNPFAAFAKGNILQIIVFACFLGISIQMAGEQAKFVSKFFEDISNVMLKMVSIVMGFAPYGVCAITAWVVGSFGIEALKPLIKFVAIYYLACLIHMVFVFGSLLKWVSRMSPIKFLKGMSEAILCAVSTTSSSATLPVTIKCAQDKLNIPASVAGFVLPLGATVNMNGTALFQGMAAVFVAQSYGIELSFTSLTVLVVTATLSAVGSAGVPGSGIITLSTVLASVGLPIEGIAILAGIDRLRDIVGTPVNILGDAVVAACVSERETKKEKEEVMTENSLVNERI